MYRPQSGWPNTHPLDSGTCSPCDHLCIIRQCSFDVDAWLCVRIPQVRDLSGQRVGKRRCPITRNCLIFCVETSVSSRCLWNRGWHGERLVLMCCDAKALTCRPCSYICIYMFELAHIGSYLVIACSTPRIAILVHFEARRVCRRSCFCWARVDGIPAFSQVMVYEGLAVC